MRSPVSRTNQEFGQFSQREAKPRGKARFAITATIISLQIVAAVRPAQSQTPQQPETRSSYERFLSTDRKVQPAVLPANLLTEVAKQQVKVKQDKSLKATQARLMDVQNERVPLSDERATSNYARLLAEVSASDNGEYAQVLFWNTVAMDATAFDHTPQSPRLSPGPVPPPRVIDQIGPARTSRALAIVHIAMFEAINFTSGKYVSYKDIRGRIATLSGFPTGTPPADVSRRHAIAFAAYSTLSALYPNQLAHLDRMLLLNLTSIQEPINRATTGTAIGEAAATAILDLRFGDGAEIGEPPATDIQRPGPHEWRRDPLNADPDRALGAFWLHVQPFVLTSASQFRNPAPPQPGSMEYKTAFDDVFKLGGDPNAGKTDPPGNLDRRPTKTDRTEEQEFIGKFWAYDATPLLCAPPRLYNMVATSLALNEKAGAFTTDLELARYLALVNVAMADAGIAAWEAKYFYHYPRPVTAIRESATENAFWSPLGAPVTNALPGRVNFTPPFPAYPSGHAVFGGTLFQVFRGYWGDDVKFEFVSDEYNGKNSDPGAPAPRPLKPRSYQNFTEAERENGRSRIYLGIHWQFDADEGIKQGNQVADFVLKNLYLESP
jgi:hypothetical protein